MTSFDMETPTVSLIRRRVPFRPTPLLLLSCISSAMCASLLMFASLATPGESQNASSPASPDCECINFRAGTACGHTCVERSHHEFPPNGRTCVPPPSPPMSAMAVYRITPRGYWALLDNTNLGDAAGDLSYVISTRFLDRDGTASVVTRSYVDVDGAQWGPYEFCNPAPGNNWSGAVCNQVFGENISYYAPACDCPRAARSVGSISQSFINAAYPEFGGWAARLGGYWYSAPKGGRCSHDAPLRTGGCSWRRSPKTTQDAVESTCLFSLLDDAARAANPKCFAACGGGDPHPVGHLAPPCFQRCWLEGIDGNSTRGLAPLTRDQLIGVWERAFSGGCKIVFTTAVVVFKREEDEHNFT